MFGGDNDAYLLRGLRWNNACNVWRRALRFFLVRTVCTLFYTSFDGGRWLVRKSQLVRGVPLFGCLLGANFFRRSLPLPSRWWTAVFCTLGLTSWVCFQSRLLSLRSRYALSMPFERDSTRLHCSRAQTVIVEVVLHLAPFVKVFEEL